MTKAAFLPTPGDPYVLKFWLNFYENVWQDEVDYLYVYLNSPIEDKVFKFMEDMVNKVPKTRLFSQRSASDHGPALVNLLKESKEDLIMFIEDDGIIFKPNMVTDCFNRIESGKVDIVGSGRGSSSSDLIEAAKKKYSLDYTGMDDQGPHFWPNFFFVKRKDLLRTDLHFHARKWDEGDEIKELGIVAGDATIGDTLVWASIQLMAMGLKIGYVPQYHAHPDDIMFFKKKENIFDGNAPWMHLGSVSSGIFGILRDENGRPLTFSGNEAVPGDKVLPHPPTTEQERNEYERRCMWWSLCYDYTRDSCQEIAEFGDKYEKAIENVIAQYNLDTNKIKLRKELYKDLLGI